MIKADAQADAQQPASVEEYVVVAQLKLKLRKGVEITSPETGSLSPGDKVVALEHGISSQGHTRMRTSKGWTTVCSADGEVFLTACDPGGRVPLAALGARTIAGPATAGPATAGPATAFRFTFGSLTDKDSLWEKNGSSTTCRICLKLFSHARWKHHCRTCGKIVCDSCSPFRQQTGAHVTVRHCNICVKGVADTVIQHKSAGRVLE